jgi:uncharacterized protein YjbJ (UPF0337 family)
MKMFVVLPALPTYITKEQIMSMNKDQVKGRVKEAEGKLKESPAKNVAKLEEKGKFKVLSLAQAEFGDVKKDVQDSTKGV